MGDARVTSGRGRVVCTPMMRHLLSLISTEIPPISKEDPPVMWLDLCGGPMVPPEYTKNTEKESKTMIQECIKMVREESLELRKYLYARLDETNKTWGNLLSHHDKLIMEQDKKMKVLQNAVKQLQDLQVKRMYDNMPTTFRMNDFVERLKECHNKVPTIITKLFLSEDEEPLPDRHMKTWEGDERGALAEELVKFLRRQARRHHRTPSAIAFAAVRALKGAGVEIP